MRVQKIRREGSTVMIILGIAVAAVAAYLLYALMNADKF